jgi:hypothetical protein
VISQTRKRDANERRPEQQSIRGVRRVRLPGFLSEDEIGLGDAIQRITYAMGVRSCGGCEKRAAALNRLLTLTG